MAKKTTLPQANDILIGRRVKEGKKEKSKDLKNYSTKEPKESKIQVSVHLSKKTFKMIEEVKYRLLADYDLKVKKSEIVEQAVRNSLKDVKGLAKSLK